MMPSGPHRSTMGRGERSSIPTVVFRLCGHPEIGPKPVADQSRERIRTPISPPPKGKLSLLPELAMRLLETGPGTPFYCEDPLVYKQGTALSADVCSGSRAALAAPKQHLRSAPGSGHSLSCFAALPLH